MSNYITLDLPNAIKTTLVTCFEMVVEMDADTLTDDLMFSGTERTFTNDEMKQIIRTINDKMDSIGRADNLLIIFRTDNLSASRFNELDVALIKRALNHYQDFIRDNLTEEFRDNSVFVNWKPEQIKQKIDVLKLQSDTLITIEQWLNDINC